MLTSFTLTSTAARRIPSASLLLVVFAVAVSLLPGAAEWLQYDRQAVAQGALWRLMTSHFVHWSVEHLFWDVLALGVLGWMCERESLSRFLVCVGVSAAIISLSLSIAEPQMTTYRGLSGIDSALFAMLAVRVGQGAFTDRDWLRLSLIGTVSTGFAAKVAFELVTGGTLFVDSSTGVMTPMPLAHVVGGLVGVVCALYKCRKKGTGSLTRGVLRGGDYWARLGALRARRSRTAHVSIPASFPHGPGWVFRDTGSFPRRVYRRGGGGDSRRSPECGH